MKLPKGILRPVKKIHGGILLNHHKNTEELETEIMPPPEMVFLPMSQHIGAHAEICVKEGDKVYVGTLVAKDTAPVSSPVHSSVSGVVDSIVIKNINGKDTEFLAIKSDGEMKLDPNLKPFKVNNAKDLSAAAKACGLVGLGGAGFPTHIKLSPSADTEIDTLIVNGAECEPYITSDYRESIEHINDTVEGTLLIKNILGIKNAVIAIEENKPESIEKINELLLSREDNDGSVKVMCLPSRYPQGAEKVIVYSATGRKMQGGELPSSVGCIVMNITSVAKLYRFITTGKPLVRKRITVDGNAVPEPKNLYVPIGTPIKDVLDYVGNIDEFAERVIFGGPMMGFPAADINSVVEKRTNAILVMKQKRKAVTTNCIGCGRCSFGCPMHLYPRKVESAYNSGLSERFEELNVNYCIECGSCSYICPAKRPLTEVMRNAKQTLRGMK